MGFLSALDILNNFGKKEVELKEVIAIEPFRINAKWWYYKINYRDKNGNTSSGVLLKDKSFPEIGAKVNPVEWTEVRDISKCRADNLNMYLPQYRV